MDKGLRRVAEMVKRHEGLRLHPYRDTTGHLTIGYGRNLATVGILPSEADMLLHQDLRRVTARLRSEPWWSLLNDVRKAVVIDMAFQLGITGFGKFKNLHAALAIPDFGRAAAEMMDSLWAQQAPTRARELATMMRMGEWPCESAPGAEPKPEQRRGPETSGSAGPA